MTDLKMEKFLQKQLNNCLADLNLLESNLTRFFYNLDLQDKINYTFYFKNYIPAELIDNGDLINKVKEISKKDRDEITEAEWELINDWEDAIFRACNRYMRTTYGEHLYVPNFIKTLDYVTTKGIPEIKDFNYDYIFIDTKNWIVVVDKENEA